MSIEQAEAFHQAVLSDPSLQREVTDGLQSSEGLYFSRLGAAHGYSFTEEERDTVLAKSNADDYELSDFELELVQAASGIHGCVAPCGADPK